jgi:hypothetical protein
VCPHPRIARSHFSGLTGDEYGKEIYLSKNLTYHCSVLRPGAKEKHQCRPVYQGAQESSDGFAGLNLLTISSD